MDFLARHVPGDARDPREDITLDAEDAAIVCYRVFDRSQVETDYDPEDNSLPAPREFVEGNAPRVEENHYEMKEEEP
jgi:hypothetical protein